LFENFSLVVAQSDQDAERFRSLGARPVATGGNLRTDIRPLPVDELELRRMRNEVGDRGVWAAVATRFGEETVAGEVHKLLRNRHPDILTVIVPSRPERGDMVETELVGLGITVARRSRKDKVSSKIEVLIGDVPGEMGLFLRFADIV